MTVLPGSFLARERDGFNPGRGHIRIALVASVAEAEEAVARIVEFTTTLQDRHVARTSH